MATYLAASTSLAHVSAAIASADNGDTVIVPAGSSDWDDTISVTKAISLIGAGIGQTVIKNTISTPSLNVGADCLFSFLLPVISAGRLRVSGFEFNGNRAANLVAVSSAELWSQCRFFNCKFLESAKRDISFVGLIAGLVDHCAFVDNGLVCTAYGGTNDDLSWQTALSLGTVNTVTVEDCTITYQNWHPDTIPTMTAGGQGARRSWRYNTIENHLDKKILPLWDVHGNQQAVTGQTFGAEPPGGTGESRGNRQIEIYRNTFTTDTFVAKAYTLTDLRGGTCLIHNNTFSGVSVATAFSMREEDGPEKYNLRSEYPGYDQHRIWIWSNTTNGAPTSETPSFSYTEDSLFIVEDVNLFWEAMPGYTELEYPHPFKEPDSPSALTATAISTSVIGLAWTINATDATSQKVRISTDGVTFTPLETIAADAETYNATGLSLTSGVQYWFDICASNSSGDSAYCTPARALEAGNVVGSFVAGFA
jgi:hypothetical protein